MLDSHEQRLSNLGSNQLIEILDKLIYSALELLCKEAPLAVQDWTGSMVYAVLTDGSKRSYSTDHNNQVLIAYAIQAAVSCTAKDISACCYDRVYVMTLLRTCEVALAKCVPNIDPTKLDIEAQSIRADTLRDLGVDTRRAYITYHTLKFYLQAAQLFIEYIAEKYYKLAAQRTTAMMRATNLSISRQDLFANNLFMILRAIMKYSANKGTLTDFIVTWMRANANPKYSHEFGIAYSLPPTKRRAVKTADWEDDGVATVNLMQPLDDAMEVTADINGALTASGQSFDAEQVSMIHSIISAAAYDPDVKAYMQLNVIPFVPPTAVVSEKTLRMWRERVNELLNDCDDMPTEELFRRVTIKTDRCL